MAKIIRLPEVIDRTGLKRSSIYSFVSSGTFPCPVPLGARAVGWIEEEIDLWIEERISQAEGYASINVKKLPNELSQYIASGEIPVFQVGRHTLVKKADVAKFKKRKEPKLRVEAV